MLIAGNWKMFKGPAQAATFCAGLRDADLGNCDVVVCPPYVSLQASLDALAGSGVVVWAQNVHWAEEGAFTGEISAGMLGEIGVGGAIVGHSERRQYFGETDQTVAARTQAALAAGLWVIACVGETGAERVDAIAQVAGSRERLVVAYEPVWAIGTGKTATAQMAQDAHAFIKTRLDVAVLYGGSVKPDNAAELASQPDVDGALVGGASLEVDSFAAICRAVGSVS
jgi:triosephosphate isomerase